jgi:hypothetical protein
MVITNSLYIDPTKSYEYLEGLWQARPTAQRQLLNSAPFGSATGSSVSVGEAIEASSSAKASQADWLRKVG